jgi:hypothetical protein
LRLGQTTGGGTELSAARVARFAAAAFDPSAITINPGGDVVLVGATNFVNSVTTTLTTGGRFIIATKSPDLIVPGNIEAGNKTPNIYNCGLAGGTCTIPTDGNHFLFSDQVFADVQVANATRMIGQPNPQFSFSASGLRTDRGDTMSDLTVGKPVTQAGPGSSAGPYAITLDSTFSPANYTLTVRPGVLQVDQQPIIPDVYHVSTDAPGAELMLPQICTSIAAAPVAYSDSDGGDAVDREWSKVKQRLVLSSCTGVRMKESCGDF